MALTNTNVSFHCNASGVPEPDISWKKDSGDIAEKHSVVQGVLNLMHIVSKDDGRYICTASNGVGSSSVSVKLMVEGNRKAYTFPLFI